MRFPLAMVLALALAFLSVSAAAHADDAAKREKAEQLFALMHMEKTYGQLLEQVNQQTDQLLKQLLPEGTQTEQQKTQQAGFRDQVRAMVSRSLSWAVLEPDYVKLYADTYSEQELDGILTFYRSPVGQAMLDKTPELMKASSAIASARMATVFPQLQKMMDDFAQQMKNGQGVQN